MADVKVPAQRPAFARPLSPHLQIYRWSWTMAMSIFHRVTGVALYLGTALVVWWLVALATGPSAYETARWAMTSLLGRLILFGYTWAVFHHMLGGLRHFVWDFGAAFERGPRMALAKATLAGSLALTVITWVVGYAVR